MLGCIIAFSLLDFIVLSWSDGKNSYNLSAYWAPCGNTWEPFAAIGDGLLSAIPYCRFRIQSRHEKITKHLGFHPFLRFHSIGCQVEHPYIGPVKYSYICMITDSHFLLTKYKDDDFPAFFVPVDSRFLATLEQIHWRIFLILPSFSLFFFQGWIFAGTYQICTPDNMPSPVRQGQSVPAQASVRRDDPQQVHQPRHGCSRSWSRSTPTSSSLPATVAS